jgi:rubrerythrin
MAIFEAKEIFKFAIRIEENGEKFYRFASNLADDEEIKRTFNYLADEEVKHKKTFTKLLSEITKDVSFENYSDEYFDYLRCYVDNVIFTEEQLEKQQKEVKDVLSAIKFAMQKELDSVLYYHEVEKFVSDKQKDLIQEIIAEERKHYAKLSEMKKNLK